MRVRRPRRWPAMPRNGASTAPAHISARRATSHPPEPVAVRMYQPRISASISKPIDVARSAGHWKRKLRTAKGARAGLKAFGSYTKVKIGVEVKIGVRALNQEE